MHSLWNRLYNHYSRLYIHYSRYYNLTNVYYSFTLVDYIFMLWSDCLLLYCTWGWAISHITPGFVSGFVGGMLALDALFSTAGEPISAHCCVGALIDNMALISRIQTWHHQDSGGTLAPEYNLLQVAKGMMAKHKLVVKPEHIKSHQDNDTAYDNLPWKAQLNCDCNQLAGSTHTWPQCLEAVPTPYILPTGHIASLEIDGTFITSHIWLESRV